MSAYFIVRLEVVKYYKEVVYMTDIVKENRGILGGIFGKDSTLLFFFLLLVIIMCNCPALRGVTGDELLFFFLLLVVLFTGRGICGGF